MYTTTIVITDILYFNFDLDKQKFWKTIVYRYMTLNLNNEEVTELQEETKTKGITNQDQDNTEILKKDLNMMKKSTDHGMTTDYNNRVVEIHFQDNVLTEKRKKVKGTILKENTQILIADMKSEYHVKTQKFDPVPCDISSKQD